MYANAGLHKKSGNMFMPYACMAVIIPILSLVLPLSLSGSPAAIIAAWLACVISAAILLITVKGFLAIIVCAFAFTFTTSAIGSPAPVAIIFGTVLAAGIYSAAVAAAKKQHVLFLIGAPLLSVALTFAMTGRIVSALLSLICFPPALVMGLGSRRGLDRTRAIALFGTVAVIELAVAVTGYIAWQNGSLSKDLIENAIIFVQNGIEGALASAIETAGAAVLDETIIMEMRHFSAAAINILPGAVSVVILTAGFFSHKTECALFSKFEKESLLESSDTPVRVSCTAAIVFLVAHVFSYTSGASHAPSFVAIAAENLSLILLPALLLTGWEKLAALPQKIGILAIAVWIGVVLLSNMLSASLISILALIGAFCILLARTDTWAKDHYRKGEDQ